MSVIGEARERINEINEGKILRISDFANLSRITAIIIVNGFTK